MIATRLRFLGLASVALAVVACSSTSGPQTAPLYGYPPGQWPPGQPPPAQPAAQAQPSPSFPWLPSWPTVRLPPPPPALGIFRPINVQALLGTLPSSPCRPHEVSPGNWVGFDCTPPQLWFMRRAVPLHVTKGFTGTGAASSLPATVDHRSEGTEGPMKSQGAVGTCTAVSLSTAMDHALRRAGIPDAVSALHIWSHYRVPQMGEAGDANVDKRLASEGVWPYDPASACKLMRRDGDSCGAAYDVVPDSADADPQIQGAKARANAAGRYQLAAVDGLDTNDPEALASLLAQGEDLWVAFNIDEEAWSNQSHQGNVIPDYGETHGSGHAVVLAGYRTVNGQRQFLIHNSWGPRWGEEGYAWISERMVATQLRYAYRVRVQGTPGGEGPLPQTSACGAGQAQDAVTGQCREACPDGGVRAAGVCLPRLPGLPAGPSLPTGPGPSPAPPTSCPAGQVGDLLTRQCGSPCPGGVPPFGGLCVPGMP
ncbi:MAG: C1 family peptidase [Myxococcales bacterium]|nr:C1 family peptidase [Myxococcales bacterium]